MPAQRHYVIPITLPFEEDEAVKLLGSVGYGNFSVEAVRRIQVLCTTAPDGRRLTVEEAMRLEVANALKQLLITEGSLLNLPAVGQTTVSNAPTPKVEHDTVVWARHAATNNLRDEIEALLSGAATGSTAAQSAGRVSGYIESSPMGGGPRLSVAGTRARRRLVELTHAVCALDGAAFIVVQLRRGRAVARFVPEHTWGALRSWSVLADDPSLTCVGPSLTCVGRAVADLIGQEV